MKQPGFFFCITHDSQLLREYISDTFLKNLPTQHTEISIYWGDEGLTPQFWEKFSITSFLCDFRIIILRKAEQLKKEEWIQLSTKLGRCPTTVFPILCLEGEWGDKKKSSSTTKDNAGEDDYFLPSWKGNNEDKVDNNAEQKNSPVFTEENNKKEQGKKNAIKKFHDLPCYKFAKKFNWLWKIQGIENVSDYLQKHATQRDITITSDALNYLNQIILPDAAAINSFLDQLCLSAEKKIFTLEDVKKISALNQEAIIFEIIAQLESGNPTVLWKNILDKSEEAENFFFPFIALLAREIRILWQIKSRELTGIAPFIVQKKSYLANRLSFSVLSAMFEKIALSEFNIKAGNHSTSQALEILVADIFNLFRQNDKAIQ